jgi:LuxR family transcriptional regulator, maltose regulon positive regulatory protein
VPLDRRGQWYRYHHLFRDMLLAELERLEPALMPVLRRRAARWCLRHDQPEDALEYSMTAGDVDTAAGLVEQLAVPARRQGRATTLQRWFEWLDDRGGIIGHPMVAVLATLIYAWMGQPAEAERWADVVDHWQYGDAARPGDPATEAWAALARALLCRRGVSRMLADAEEAARGIAAEGVVTPGPALLRGIAHVLSGDLDDGDAFLNDAVSLGETAGADEIIAQALSERSMVAMARSDWTQAEVLAGQARSALRQAGIGESYVTPLVCAVQARVALHSGDVPAARQEAVHAQRTRSLLSRATPHVAVQARIELARVHLALADLTGAVTVMREIDELLNRRPGLGTLVGEARALRGQLSAEHAPATIPGASSLTGAELRVLPMLATHLSFPEIAADLCLSPHTVKSQAMSIYRKLGASSRSRAVTRSRELGLLEG